MIIYLYGKDSYRRGEKAKIIIEEYKKKHSVWTVQSFDLAEAEKMGSFKDALIAQSLFDPFSFIAVAGLFPAITDLAKEFAPVLRGVLTRKETVLLIVADEAPPKAFDFLINKPATAQEFALFSAGEFEKFVFIEARKRGVNLSPSEAARFARVCASDSWRAISELEKLAVSGKIDSASDRRTGMDFFQGVLAMKKNSQARMALPILERLVSREDSAAIFNVLASLVAPEERARFADYDIQIKTGVLDYDLALTDFVLGK